MIYITTRIENQSRIKRLIGYLGIDTCSRWLEMDGDTKIEDMWPIFKEDMQKAKVLFAFIFQDDKRMAGGFIEMGMAYALNIPIVVYCEPSLKEAGLTTFHAAPTVFVFHDLKDALSKVLTYVKT